VNERAKAGSGESRTRHPPVRSMSVQGIERGRLSTVVGGLLLALALSRLIEFPARPLQVNVLGSPLGVDLSGTTLVLLVVVGLAITGVQSLLSLHPSARPEPRPLWVMYWIVPALLGAGLVLWLRQIDDLGRWTLALLAAAFLITLAMVTEYRTVSLTPTERGGAWLQWGRMALIHLVAFILFTVIYGMGLRRLLGGPTVWVIATLLGARYFWGLTRELRRSFAYGAAVGLATALTLWVLNLWQLSALRGGWLLLVFFYLAVGLLKERLAGRLDRRIALEYVVVGLLAFLTGLIAFP